MSRPQQNRKRVLMEDLTSIAITDDTLQDAIERKAAQLRSVIAILHLVRQHIPSGRGDYYRYIPQPLRHQFLANLQALGR